jgi:Fic family protein
MSAYKWKPIEPLSDKDRKIDLAAMRPLYETWRTSRERIEKTSPSGLREFNEKLIRRLSIETGILEHLYDLDVGTTEALVAQGFVEDYVGRASTDIEPARLIDILRDHEAAIQLTMDCVAHNRALTKGLINELHAILTRHQDVTTAVDQFGNRFDIPLLKGKFKEQPNNPKRPDGNIHEYCPPIHVEAEMDNLLHWLSTYGAEDPVIVAAWLQHRFTQIHPYQDGNGRVSRALTTLILLRADILPLVIDRNLRVDYIKALETADLGDLTPLAELFAGLERNAILQGLSVDAEKEVSHQRTLTSAVIDSLAEKLGKRREAKHAELRSVNTLALALREHARKSLEGALNELSKTLSKIEIPEIRVADGGPDRGNAHWYKFEVVNSANAAGKFANFSENHYFVKASVRFQRERLIFVTSFHHVGRDLSGIMEATSFSRLESFEDSDDRDSISEDYFPCSLEPFVFTYKTKESDIQDAFGRWLDGAFAVAVKEYGDRI